MAWRGHGIVSCPSKQRKRGIYFSVPVTVVIIFVIFLLRVMVFVVGVGPLLQEADVVFFDGAYVYEDFFEICMCGFLVLVPTSWRGAGDIHCLISGAWSLPSSFVLTPFNSLRVTNCFLISPSL